MWKSYHLCKLDQLFKLQYAFDSFQFVTMQKSSQNWEENIYPCSICRQRQLSFWKTYFYPYFSYEKCKMQPCNPEKSLKRLAIDWSDRLSESWKGDGCFQDTHTCPGPNANKGISNPDRTSYGEVDLWISYTLLGGMPGFTLKPP